MSKLSEADRDYIRDSWASKSCAQIAEHLGVNKTSVFRAGKKMGLGKKPDAKAVAAGKEQAERETVASEVNPQSFFVMIDSTFEQLASERQALLNRLNQLGKLPDD